MNALEALWELGPRSLLSLYHVEVFAVAVTLVVYFCIISSPD
ncbi:hypothetical protein BIW11_04708 [Tropilaelaps mercedesae]|uniref:Uncharacterized protein n=1 Tax=Tropilaelaps mercedesae TaxID=418985 RepID=A0A1V9X2V0_9ACAR|nr:hypothetical protein BIW11_04708 [Tropilaelaps mercedesae]